MVFPSFLFSRRNLAGRTVSRSFRTLRLESLETRLTPTSLYDPQSLLIRLQPNELGGYSSQPVSLLPGLEMEHSYNLVPGLWRARVVDPSVSVDSLLGALKSDPRVAYAVPNGINQAESLPNDPRFSQQWHLAQPVGPSIHADSSWRSFTGNGINTVAIFDTGLDLSHPDLKNRIWVNAGEVPGDGLDNDANGIIDDYQGASFFQGRLSGSVTDGDGHGTAVAGLIGATGNNGVGVVGVNWAATLLPLKVIQGGQALDGDILHAMDYATRAGSRIWNLSLGGGGYSRAMADAFEAATQKGIIVVTAAGNNGQNTDVNPHFPSSYTAENVIAVAATDSSDQLARFSNYGLASVDIAAPGTNLLTTLPGGNYGMRQGTSMAAALVTGAVSLLWDKTPAASSSHILDTLLNGSKVLTSLKGLVQSGIRLDLGGTIDSIVDARPINPLPGNPLPGGITGAPTNPSLPFLPESTDTPTPHQPWLPTPVQPPQPNRPSTPPSSGGTTQIPGLPIGSGGQTTIPPGGNSIQQPPIVIEPGVPGPSVPSLPGGQGTPLPGSIGDTGVVTISPSQPVGGGFSPSLPVGGRVLPLLPLPFPIIFGPGGPTPGQPVMEDPGAVPGPLPPPKVDPTNPDSTEEEEMVEEGDNGSESDIWVNYEEWEESVLWQEWE